MKKYLDKFTQKIPYMGVGSHLFLHISMGKLTNVSGRVDAVECRYLRG